MDEATLFKQPPSPYEIETRQGPKENEIGFCPKRGGIITSMKLRGQEILYLDQATFNDPKQKVKGGVPILFPNAGPLPENGPYQLAQHGFARTSDKWTAKDTGGNEMTETLTSDDETKKQFPFDCSLTIKTKLEDDGSVTLTQGTKNLETICN